MMNNPKKWIFPLASLMASLCFSSCLQHEITVHLKKDGSGTLVEETRLSAQALAMMSMGGNFAEEAGNDPDDKAKKPQDPLNDMLSEDKAKQRATQLGEGVSLVKIEPVTLGDAQGARVTYRFTDINKLRISPDDMTKSMQNDPDKKDAKEQKQIVFAYKNGTLAIRTNLADKKEPPQDKKAEAKEVDIRQIGMMKQMLADMKIGLKLTAESGIADTNATHRTGDSITLIEMDMNKVIAKPENMKMLMQLGDELAEDTLESMNQINGIRIETKPEITVRLK